jgi:hypothetical protein
MKAFTNVAFLTAAIAFALASAAGAAEVLVGDAAGGRQAADLIDTSTTWTKDNVYRLQDQIFVMPGATLTIEAGTVVASAPTANGSGSLAVTRGGKIYVQGTEDEPVIMTSSNDVATWDAGDHPGTGKDPKTGSWREAALEWGNLTMMGDALIAEDAIAGNTAQPTGENVAAMEGLVAEGEDDESVLYGGDNDDDNSGSISYLSIRYGGRVVGLNNELNGLSLGGIGRDTDMNHIEIMNNVDDGAEIWGGTVQLKYITIWNIGDDSFDIDQGWRGKAQYVLIVQGYSLDADQGSGVGDNGFETDGAEDSDYQPVTTATIYNATFIGQPVDGAGDGATAWRDNARVQYRKCIFMDCGEKVVRFDNVDGDGAQGYGHNGTLSWADTWTTAYTHSHDWDATVNAYDAPGEPPEADFRHPLQLYQAQSQGDAGCGQGFLAEITDSVFFRNLSGAAYTEANARGVTVGGGSNPAKCNVVIPGSANADSPIRYLDRAGPVTKGGKTMLRVIDLDPRAANEATTAESHGTGPICGFFDDTTFRGAFSPSRNWARNWTAADAYDFYVVADGAPTDQPEDPESGLAVVATVVSFETTDGVTYLVEVSSDGQNWSPFGVVEGDGTTMQIQDFEDFDSTKIYRVSPL